MEHPCSKGDFFVTAANCFTFDNSLHLWRRKMKKYVLFVFNGDPMCFIHVLLNALDLSEKGYSAGIVVEGSATGLIPELDEEKHPLHKLWVRVREEGLVFGACRACSRKMGTLEDAQKQGLSLLDDMSGHPGMAGYIEKGYDVITF